MPVLCRIRPTSVEKRLGSNKGMEGERRRKERNQRNSDKFYLVNNTIHVAAQWPFLQADYPSQSLCYIKKGGEQSTKEKERRAVQQQSMLPFVLPDIWGTCYQRLLAALSKCISPAARRSADRQRDVPMAPADTGAAQFTRQPLLPGPPWLLSHRRQAAPTAQGGEGPFLPSPSPPHAYQPLRLFKG